MAASNNRVLLLGLTLCLSVNLVISNNDIPDKYKGKTVEELREIRKGLVKQYLDILAKHGENAPELVPLGKEADSILQPILRDHARTMDRNIDKLAAEIKAEMRKKRPSKRKP